MYEAKSGERAYTTAVVREVLRLYPPPWLIARRARREVPLGRYRIPAGATVMFSPYAVHRDPANYPQPDQFDPHRWLAGNEPVRQQLFLPFGAGPHRCIGEGLAVTELVIVAIEVLRHVRPVPLRPTTPRALATLAPRHAHATVLRRHNIIANG